MKAKVKQSAFVFTPANLPLDKKVIYADVAFRELLLQLSAQLNEQIADLSAVLYISADRIRCSDATFHSDLENDKKLLLDLVKQSKIEFDKEYN